MILVQCAACAAPLGLALGKKCGRCSTRYCGPACQEQHWKEGGHDKLCKKIKRAGGAEQYNANQKYTAAVTVAAEACADDTKGQTCYICTQALHWKTKEGLVRMCACRGTAGFAHVSCLAEQAKILWAEAEENNLEDKFDERWDRWAYCSLCEQRYHGVVKCALGWACWKTYLGRPERDQIRGMAMNLLGLGLEAVEHHEDALSVKESELATMRRRDADEGSILIVQSNLASTYQKLRRFEEARLIQRDVYFGFLKLHGGQHQTTLIEADNYASTLFQLQRFEEAKSLFRKTVPVTQRVLGESDELTLRMRWNYASSLFATPGATLQDTREAVAILEDIEQIARRVLGGAHPVTVGIETNLGRSREAREILRAREASEPAGAMAPGDA